VLRIEVVTHVGHDGPRNVRATVDENRHAPRTSQFAALVSAKGRCFWYPKAFLTQRHVYGTGLLAYWKLGEDEPWLLATNLLDATTTLRACHHGMGIEEMFGDWQGHGLTTPRPWWPG